MTSYPSPGWPPSATAWLPTEHERDREVGSLAPGRARPGSTLGETRPRVIRLMEPSWLGEVIEAMLLRLDEVHADLLDELADASPSYRSLVDAPGFAVTSRSRLGWLHEALATLANGGTPDTAPLEALAAERRDQGVALEELRAAHRIAADAVWRSFLVAVEETGADRAEALEQGARLHRSLTEEMVTAITSGFLSATENRSPGARLISGLTSPGGPSGELAELCRAVSLDPDGLFLAAAVGGSGGRVSDDDVRGVVGSVGADLVVLTQHHGTDLDAAEAELHDLLTQLVPGAVVGTGLSRKGLDGAAASIDEARRALSAAVQLGEPGLRYRSRWAAAMALEARDDVSGVLAPLIELLEQDTELMATARAYLAADGSLSRAAEELYLHANTVRYRLGRIAELSGIDVRTMMGGWSLYIALTVALSDEVAEDRA